MSVLSEIGRQLDRFVWDELGEELVHDLAGEFLHAPYEVSNPHFDVIDEVAHGNSLFVAWLWQDYLHNSKTMLEHFQASQPKLTSDQSRRLDQMVQTSFMSAFKVGEVRPGNIELEDLRSGTRYRVREYSLASQVHTDHFLILRLCLQDDHWEIIMPDGSMLPFTLESEVLTERFVNELPETPTMQHTTGYIMLRHELGIESMQPHEPVAPPAQRQLSKKDAAAQLQTAMAQAGVDTYISPTKIMHLIDEEFAAEDLQPQPCTGVRILLSLADGKTAFEQLMEAGTVYWNSHVSKTALKKRHVPDIAINEFHPGLWRALAKEAHEHLAADEPVAAAEVYDRLFAQMLAERQVTPSLYRLVTNAAVAQLAQGKILYGRELLETAQAMCPSYDFAWQQEELLESGVYHDRQMARLMQESGWGDVNEISQAIDSMQERLGPSPDIVQAYSDEKLVTEFAKRRATINPESFAIVASKYNNQSDFAEELTGKDSQYVDAVYALLDEARNRWAQSVIWVDTLHTLADEYNECVYDDDGYESQDYPAITEKQEHLHYALQAANNEVVAAWMHDTREYADHRQNIVLAALATARAKPKQPRLHQAALALCELAARRTDDPIFGVPQLLADEPKIDEAAFNRRLRDLGRSLPDDYVSFQIIGDQFSGQGVYGRAIAAYRCGLAALDRRRRAKRWQDEPYSYETLAESYEYLGEELHSAYVANGQQAEAKKLAKKLAEIENDTRLQHNAMADGMTKIHEDMVAQEAGDSPILRYLRWFDTLDIDLSSGDGEPTMLTPYANGEQIGRNDPCPCGKLRPNGLPMKYKNCCGVA